jgi:hypothetical protein
MVETIQLAGDEWRCAVRCHPIKEHAVASQIDRLGSETALT